MRGETERDATVVPVRIEVAVGDRAVGFRRRVVREGSVDIAVWRSRGNFSDRELDVFVLRPAAPTDYHLLAWVVIEFVGVNLGAGDGRAIGRRLRDQTIHPRQRAGRSRGVEARRRPAVRLRQ